MTGFPKVPVMLTPFAGETLDKSDDFPLSPTSSGASEITYTAGIPVAKTFPTDSGGSPFKRREMNRLGYVATIGTYKSQMGFCETFNPEVAEKCGGYPAGAILKWFQFAVLDKNEELLPPKLQVNFGGIWEVLDKNRLTEYKMGDVVEYGDYLNVFFKDADDNISEYSIHAYITPVMIVSVIDVVSQIGNNKNDFRTTGPTGLNEQGKAEGLYNGWTALDDVIRPAFPDYSVLGSADSIMFEGNSGRSFNSTELTTPTDGWIVVNLSRTMLDSDLATLGDVVMSYSDGFTVYITPAQMGSPACEVSKQFGGLDKLTAIIPVSESSTISVSAKNNMGSQMHMEVRMVPTVK